MRAPQKYFIQEHLHRTVFHGGAGNIDVEKILASKGYKAIEFPGTFDFSLWSKLKRSIYLLKTLFTITAEDIVVFQFPLYARIHDLLLKLLRVKKVQIVCLIADIEGLRNVDAELLAKEKKVLSGFSLFISHNSRMSEWLRGLVPEAIIAEIQFFDFLAIPANQPRKRSKEVVFAGNLQKSPFIQHLEQLYEACPDTTFFIYGADYPKHHPFPQNAIYKGFFSPYEIVNRLEGSFGLIWDGPDISTCRGSYGQYLAYNSPHKLSLYILAGIPLIVPEGSASALLVRKYGIGRTIKQLAEIETVINTISDTDYELMVANTRPLAIQLSQGHLLKEALDQLERSVFEKGR